MLLPTKTETVLELVSWLKCGYVLQSTINSKNILTYAVANGTKNGIATGISRRVSIIYLL